MENSREKSRIGGILSIVCGSFGIIGAFTLIMVTFLIRYLIINTGPVEDPYADNFIAFAAIFYGIMAFFQLAAGVLGIIGGIFALKRRHWGVALAAAIVGLFTFFPCGIAAVILTSMARPEFNKPKSPVYAEPLAAS